LLDVDLLALEFNHDVELEYRSGRHPRLISRVLGDDGHLSNEQAAQLLREILRRSTLGRLRHLVQLHLSRECNRPALALKAARDVLDGHGAAITIHTASQDEAGPTLHVGGVGRIRRQRTRGLVPQRERIDKHHVQPWLPGCERA
jgi:hypothetical protein